MSRTLATLLITSNVACSVVVGDFREQAGDSQNVFCWQDADCVTPEPCEVSDGATCIDGMCAYRARAAGVACDDGNPCTVSDECDGAGHCAAGPDLATCSTPPDPVCLEADSVLRTYGAEGTCNPLTGDCSYPFVDTPCPSCTATCTGRCDEVDCSDLEGGCQTNGICIPEDPPRCRYEEASDGALCDLGVCLGAACVECIDSSGCDGSTPVCDPATHTCVGCTSVDRCALDYPSTPVCAPDGACVECLGNGNGNGDCAECLQCTANQCENAPNQTACGTNGVCEDGLCVGCIVDSDCGFCQACDAGVCVNQSDTDTRNQCNLTACNSGLCSGGACKPMAGATLCRSAGAGGGDLACDLAEVCDGAALTCPGDTFVAPGVPCGLCAACDGNGGCNVALGNDPACVIDCSGLPVHPECRPSWNATHVCDAIGTCSVGKGCAPGNAPVGTPCEEPPRSESTGQNDGWAACDGLGNCAPHLDVHAVMRTCAWAQPPCPSGPNGQVAVFIWITGGPPGNRCGRFTYLLEGASPVTLDVCDGDDGDVDGEIVINLTVDAGRDFAMLSEGAGSYCRYLHPATQAPLAGCEGVPCNLCVGATMTSCPTTGTPSCP